MQKDWFNIAILTLSQNAKFVKRQENLVKWLSQYAKYKTENRLLEFLRGIGNRINYFEEIELETPSDMRDKDDFILREYKEYFKIEKEKT